MVSVQDADSPTGRGKLRTYLGIAPGVGKTYAMLREARARRRVGVDTVVAQWERHGRPETAAQLDDLAPPARNAARRASVAGRRFPLDALPPLGVLDVGPAVDGLARRALVGEPREDAALGPTLRFRHALLRDTAYAGLSRADRSSLHHQLAGWLAARPEDVVPMVLLLASPLSSWTTGQIISVNGGYAMP